LYEKYKGRVGFVIVDLDARRSPGQRDLVEKYYKGSIPLVVILNEDGHAIYNAAGEVDESRISDILEKILKGSP